MKTCFKCGLLKPMTEFYTHPEMADGRLNKCKDCTMLDVRQNRRLRPEQYSEYERKRYKSNPERRAVLARGAARYRRENPEAYRAHTALGNAVRDGKINRSPCLFCEKPGEHAHHNSYSRPLDVIWLCARCHNRLHANFPAIEGHALSGVAS